MPTLKKFLNSILIKRFWPRWYKNGQIFDIEDIFQYFFNQIRDVNLIATNDNPMRSNLAYIKNSPSNFNQFFFFFLFVRVDKWTCRRALSYSNVTLRFPSHVQSSSNDSSNLEGYECNALNYIVSPSSINNVVRRSDKCPVNTEQ